MQNLWYGSPALCMEEFMSGVLDSTGLKLQFTNQIQYETKSSI